MADDGNRKSFTVLTSNHTVTVQSDIMETLSLITELHITLKRGSNLAFAELHKLSLNYKQEIHTKKVVLINTYSFINEVTDTSNSCQHLEYYFAVDP